MSKLEILCATMHQTDFSKIQQMNIKSNVVFANQADTNGYQEIEFDGHTAKMVTTTTRGVGVNRNLALKYATGDILLFADDDMLYEDDLEENVERAFNELPKADVIIFRLKYSKKNIVYYTTKMKTKKLSYLKSLKYGTAVLAIRRTSLLKANLNFSELFGGGCVYCKGEDSDFVVQCYRKKLKVYTYDYIIGTTVNDTSSWFKGYTEKYFYDTGALAKHTMKKWGRLYMRYMAFRIKKGCNLSFRKKMKCMKAGFKGFKSLRSYTDWAGNDTNGK